MPLFNRYNSSVLFTVLLLCYLPIISVLFTVIYCRLGNAFQLDKMSSETDYSTYQYTS